MHPRRAPTLTAILVVVAAYGWTFLSEGDQHLTRQPAGYYGLLTDAIVSGHFYLKERPDPRLALLADPWAPEHGIPKMDDAAYFRGRYYLYFGVTPVMILFAPWRLMTGAFLPDGAGVCLFGLAGFLLGLDVLVQLERSQRLRVAEGWRAAGVLVWGFGSYVFVILQTNIYLCVPITAAYFCLMLALSAAGRAAASRSPRPAAFWMGTASLAWAMAVGCRPHYLLAIPALLVPLAYCLVQMRGARPAGSRMLLVAAAILPAALVGAGLAWYNFSRFGSILEFGQHYEFAAGDQRSMKLLSPDHALSNLRVYLLSDGFYLIYFPFLVARGPVCGLIPTMPFSLLGAAFPFVLFSREFRRNPVWMCIGACLLVAGTVIFLVLCAQPAATDRYVVDFSPAWTLMALAASMPVLGGGTAPGTPFRRVAAALILCAAAASVTRAWILVLGRTPDASTRSIVEAEAERAVSKAESVAGIKFGPLKFSAALQALDVGSREALVETGGGGDGLFAERIDSTHLRIGFVHLGNFPILGRPFSVREGGSQSLWADLGSFYPPETNPFFRGWEPSLVDAQRRRIRVTVDGELVLSGSSTFYPSDPFHVVVGKDSGLGMPDFSGSISRPEVQPPQGFERLKSEGWTGPVSLRLMFPSFETPHSEPLVATGTRGASDIIYVAYLSPTSLRFGHDSSDGGAIETADIAYDSSSEHTLDVSYDALYQGLAPDIDRVVLKFDGKWVLRARRTTHPTTPYDVVFGYNAYGMGTVAEAFAGEVTASPIDSGAFVQRLPPQFGAAEAVIQFVPMPPNVSEPLVVSGVTGRGDIVFVHYDDPDHVRFGIDHWGIGGVVGSPVEIRYGQSYRLRVSSATFLPPRGSPDWGGVSLAEQDRELSAITVGLDGAVVAVGPWRGYPSAAENISFGMNPIGGSTCGPTFSGRILSFGRATKDSHP